MTTLPPGFGAQSIPGYDPGVFTWITTTRSDGSSTVLPIVGGLALWEVPTILNVRFQFNLPGFHIPRFSFPCIRVLSLSVGNCDTPPTNDENSHASSSSPPSQASSSPTTTTSPPSSTESSSSCTGTQTTTDCQVTCSLSVMSNGGTSTDCYTTVCSITRAPCSITATTSTTVLSTTSAMQCPFAPNDDEVSSFADDVEHSILNDLASTTTTDTLIKSVGRDLNMCTLTMNTALTSVTWPEYPGAGTILKEDLAAAGVSTGTGGTPYLQGTRTSLLRWLSATTDTANCAPSIVSLSALDYQAAWDSAPQSRKSGCSPTFDHAFEKNWLKLFFQSIIDPNAQPLSSYSSTLYVVRRINCADIHNLFFGIHRTRNTMGELFNAMPGGDANFLSLAGMTKTLNNAAKVRCRDDSTIQRKLTMAQGKVANLEELIYMFDKALDQKSRVNPTGNFGEGYSKARRTVDMLDNVYLGFEVLNRPDIGNLMEESFWQVWDVL